MIIICKVLFLIFLCVYMMLYVVDSDDDVLLLCVVWCCVCGYDYVLGMMCGVCGYY